MTDAELAISKSLEPPFAPGGSGGPYNVKLALQAVANRWPIPAEKRAPLIEWLLKVAEHSPDDRCKIGAAATILRADAMNMEQEKRELQLPDQRVLHSGDKDNPIQVEHSGRISITTEDVLAAKAILAGAGGDLHRDD